MPTFSSSPTCGGDPDPNAEPRAEKAALRRHFRRLRRDSLAAASPGLRRQARRQLPGLLPTDSRLGLYWPIGSEPDLAPQAAGGLVERLAGRLALPAVLAGECGAERGGQDTPAAAGEAPPGQLVYLPWSGERPLGCDACGIPAPLPSQASAVQPLPAAALGLLLVPALAIDQAGIRLGSGGGWYDRLRADPAWRQVPALAVLPAACVCRALPRDPWDIPFDGYLHEHGVTWLPRAEAASSQGFGLLQGPRATAT